MIRNHILDFEACKGKILLRFNLRVQGTARSNPLVTQALGCSMRVVETIKRVDAPPLSQGEVEEALSRDSDFAKVASTSWQWIGAPSEAELFGRTDETPLSLIS